MPQVEDGKFGSALFLWRSKPELFFFILCNSFELRFDLIDWLKNHLSLVNQCGADLSPTKKGAEVNLVAQLPDFIGVLLRIPDDVTRAALLAVPFVKDVLLNKYTVENKRKLLVYEFTLMSFQVKNWSWTTSSMTTTSNHNHAQIKIHRASTMVLTKVHDSKFSVLEYIKAVSDYDHKNPESHDSFSSLVEEWCTVHFADVVEHAVRLSHQEESTCK